MVLYFIIAAGLLVTGIVFFFPRKAKKRPEELAGTVVTTTRRDDVSAFVSEPRCDLEADAGRRAGDETDLSCETEIHGSLR